MRTHYTLTIDSGSDACISTKHATRLDAMDAADAAAETVGCVARYGSWSAGMFIDTADIAHATFTIEAQR